MQEFKIPTYVQTAVNRLESCGFASYIVGGAIRNMYMNLAPVDFDITTKAHPDEIIKVFSDCRTIETGKKFGTITVVIEGKNLEITTFRADGEYLNNRSPESVSFSENIEEDLKRRDFTVNALCFSQSRGEIDLFGGKADIENKIIRAIGNPDARFSEDALRILRAIRFSSVLGFEIEPVTEKSIFKNKTYLQNISKERIRDEFNKIITSNYAKNTLLKYRDVISVFIPEISTNCSQSEIFEHSCDVLLNAEDILSIRLAVFLFENRILNSKEILTRLKYDKKTINSVKFLIEHYEDFVPNEKKELKHLLYKYGPRNLSLLFKMKKADHAQKLMEIIIENKECFSLKDLKIGGDDLKAFGIFGEKIGETLNYLLNEVIEERIENTKQALLNKVKSIPRQ